METFRLIQNQLGMIPVDGVAVTILAYYLSPSEDKIRNTLIIGGTHGLLHFATCKIQTADGLI